MELGPEPRWAVFFKGDEVSEEEKTARVAQSGFAKVVAAE